MLSLQTNLNIHMDANYQKQEHQRLWMAVAFSRGAQ